MNMANITNSKDYYTGIVIQTQDGDFYFSVAIHRKDFIEIDFLKKDSNLAMRLSKHFNEDLSSNWNQDKDIVRMWKPNHRMMSDAFENINDSNLIWEKIN